MPDIIYLFFLGLIVYFVVHFPVCKVLRVLIFFSSLAKKTQSVIQTLKKDGVLTTNLEQTLRSCRSVDELDHVVHIILIHIGHLNILNL